MTELEQEIQDLRRRLNRKEDEAKAYRSELGVAKEALCWARNKLQDVQDENRRLKRMLMVQEEVKQ